MVKVKVTMELNVGVGSKPARTKEEGILVDLLGGQAMTVSELVEEMTLAGKLPRTLALKIIKGAILVGVLQAFAL